jgi:hypothetical protein
MDERLIVMTEERLDYLAKQFSTLKIREITGTPFGSYLRDPDHYERLATRLLAESSARSSRLIGVPMQRAIERSAEMESPPAGTWQWPDACGAMRH